MANNNSVRFSRDGDQFHYLWAARRCLRLLSPESDLVAISIEDASPSENGSDRTFSGGEEIIDVAEYEGSERFEDASSVRYF